MNQNEPIDRMWRVYETIRDMLRDRGYDDKLIAGKNVTNYDQFKKEFVTCGKIEKQNMNLICKKMTKGQDLMMVCFMVDESININHIKRVYQRMKMHQILNCIIVYPKIITISTKKHLDKDPTMNIEQFVETDLVINITKHVLMPKYEVLSPEEKYDFLKSTRILESQLPRIMYTDPVSKYFGIKRGDILKIIRKSETSGIYIMYRICN